MKTCASDSDVIRTVVATSGRWASKWRWKERSSLETGWSQIVGDAEAPAAVDSRCCLTDPGAIAIENRQERFLALRGARGKVLQGRRADEK